VLVAYQVKQNIMTKRELINEAYLKLGYLQKDIDIFVDEDGWAKHIAGNSKELTINDYGVSFRPEELFKIELNNGWVKIESELDLVLDSDFYWTTTKNNDIWQTHFDDIEIGRHTHFQRIAKPNPPLYYEK
jgi:hypothetical protein